jgi:hypothetical protein
MMGMAPMAGSAAEQQPMVVIEVQSIPAVRNDYANLLKGMGLPGNPAKMTGPLEAMLPGLSMRDTNLPMRVYVARARPLTTSFISRRRPTTTTIRDSKPTSMRKPSAIPRWSGQTEKWSKRSAPTT